MNLLRMWILIHKVHKRKEIFSKEIFKRRLKTMFLIVLPEMLEVHLLVILELTLTETLEEIT